jgi:non-specific serine/threonine protein kinase
VFAGGCDLQAAVVVADAGIEVVSELVDHSLMRRDGERYRMLDTIRSFAAEDADGQGETTEFRDRHLAHYIALMARVFQGGEEVDGRHAWLRTCQLERDNLRAALDHALAGGDGSLVEAITRPVGIYWLLAGAMREGERWTQARLDQIDPSRVGDRARAIMVLAEYPRWAGEHDRAIALRTEAIALARQSGDSEILATLLDDISWSLAANGRLEEAQAAVAEALELREREPDDAMGMAHTLSARADLYLREHRPQAALDLIPAIRACDERTPRQPIAIETDQLEAHALLDAGRRDEADGRLRYVLHASIQDDFRIGMLSALEGLARLAADEDPPRAAQLIGIADRVRAESGLGGYDPEAFTRLGADLRSRCGAEEFDAQRAAGHALPIAAIESAVLA